MPICVHIPILKKIKGARPWGESVVCIPARSPEHQFFRAIWRRFSCIPIDLPIQFSIEKIILHLLVENERDQRDRPSLLNSCQMPWGKFLGAILGHFHWIPIDLPFEFSPESVILNLLVKTEGNRRGRRSLLNPCWIPAYFRYIPNTPWHTQGPWTQICPHTTSAGDVSVLQRQSLWQITLSLKP